MESGRITIGWNVDFGGLPRIALPGGLKPETLGSGTFKAIPELAFMPRFFFDLKFDGEAPSHDEQGSLLPDLEAAQVEASCTLTDLLKDMVRGDRSTNSLAVIVRDENGPVLQATLSFEVKRLS